MIKEGDEVWVKAIVSEVDEKDSALPYYVTIYHTGGSEYEDDRVSIWVSESSIKSE